MSDPITLFAFFIGSQDPFSLTINGQKTSPALWHEGVRRYFGYTPLNANVVLITQTNWNAPQVSSADIQAVNFSAIEPDMKKELEIRGVPSSKLQEAVANISIIAYPECKDKVAAYVVGYQGILTPPKKWWQFWK